MDFLSLIITNFIPVSLSIIFISTILGVVQFQKRIDTRIQFGTNILTILSLMGLFWAKLSKLEIKSYAFLLPVSDLIIVFISSALLFNSIKRYFKYYSQIELRLIFFYLFNFMVWFILFLQDIYSIGSNNVKEIAVLPFLGSLVLILTVATAISIYYIGKFLFFPRYKLQNVVEVSLFVAFGFILGMTLSDNGSSLFINSEPYHQQTVVLPNLIQPYGLIVISILFVPYMIIAWKSRSTRKKLIEADNVGGKIDPLSIPRLWLIETTMYIYIIGAGMTFLLILLPQLLPHSTIPGLNTVLVVPFITMVDIMLFFSFQTPEWLKKRWLRHS